MPVGPYPDMETCIEAESDKDDPAAFCADLERRTSGEQASLCVGCAHLRGANSDGTARCDAFSVIPAAIWSGDADHREPYTGDGGITFAPLGEYGRTVERVYAAQVAAVEAFPGPPDEKRPARVVLPHEEMPDAPPEEVHGVLVIEGQPTGDRRMFAPEALTWRDLPLPIEWQRQSGEGHEGSAQVGNWTRLVRDGSTIHGYGYLFTETEDGREFGTMLDQAGVLGVSVDVDDADVEVDWPDTEAEDDEGMMLLMGDPDLVVFTRARICAATVVSVPAVDGAFIERISPADAVVEPDSRDVLIASAAPEHPPTAWFRDPNLTGPTPLTITDEGQVFGHLATWGTCHTGFQGACVTPPMEDDYSYFTTGEVLTAEGGRVCVGQITLGTGHADLGLDPRRAAEHYDHTGTAVMDVAAGRDKHGIWVAGALRPDVTPLDVRRVRASAISGDWRRIAGRLRLVAALAVNVPGYPIPRTAAHIAAGAQTSLVAAGTVHRSPIPGPSRRRSPWNLAGDHLARKIQRDRRSLVAAMAESVKE